MNLLQKTVKTLADEAEPLYLGEIAACTGFKKWQVEEVLITLILVGYVKETYNKFKLVIT